MAENDAESIEQPDTATPAEAVDEEVLQELEPQTPVESTTAEQPVPARGIDALMGVSMNVQIVLGRCRLPISELLELDRGSVIEMDRRIGEAVDVLVNDRLVARGDLVKLADERVGVTLKEIVEGRSSDE